MRNTRHRVGWGVLGRDEEHTRWDHQDRLLDKLLVKRRAWDPGVSSGHVLKVSPPSLMSSLCILPEHSSSHSSQLWGLEV